jgi:hypothetical protein
MTYTWLFVRGEDALSIQRPTAVSLTISSVTGQRRDFAFATPATLLEFQCGFHSHLIETGWVLEDFSPERRGGGDDQRRAPNARDRRVVLTHTPRRPRG